MTTSNPRYNVLTQPLLIKYQLIATYVLLLFCVLIYLNLDNEVLNIIQPIAINKLKKKNNAQNKKYLNDALLTSIAGISAAMKNTG